MRGNRAAVAASVAAAVAVVASLALFGLDVTEGGPLRVSAPDFPAVAAVLAGLLVSGLLSGALSAAPLARATGPLGLAGVWAAGALPALLITPPHLLHMDHLTAPWGAVHLTGGLLGAGVVGLIARTRTPEDVAWLARPIVAGAAAIAALWIAVIPVEALDNELPISSDTLVLLALPVIALVTVGATVGVCLSGPPQPRAQLGSGFVAGVMLFASLPDPKEILWEAARLRHEALVVCAIPLVSVALVAGGLQIQRSVRYRRAQREEG